jgi:hypothetical protein
MTLTKKLAIGILVGALGFSSVALAKKKAGESKSFHVIGHVVSIDTNTRHITVKDSYSGKLYTMQVPKGFRVRSLNTSSPYTSFETLQPGIQVQLEVRSATSESAQTRTR